MGYFGHPLFGLSCLFGLFMSNIFFFGGSFWLSIWVEAYNKKGYVDVAFYMGIYAVFTFLELISFGFIIIMFEWGAWRAARTLHNDFIRAIMRVPLSWFKLIPIGRITNRFSGDMASIDGMLSNMLRAALDAVMMIFFRIAAVSTIMPVFMIPALFTCLFGVVIGEMYTRTAVVVKRLTSSAQSPVFSQFADTLAGLSIIRARAGKSHEFGRELAAKLRVWSAASETNYNANRWVAVRVDFVTSLVALSAGIIAVSQVGLVGAGLVGFSLTNANGLSQTILMLVRAMNDLEVEIQSVSCSRTTCYLTSTNTLYSFIVSRNTLSSSLRMLTTSLTLKKANTQMTPLTLSPRIGPGQARLNFATSPSATTLKDQTFSQTSTSNSGPASVWLLLAELALAKVQ